MSITQNEQKGSITELGIYIYTVFWWYKLNNQSIPCINRISTQVEMLTFMFTTVLFCHRIQSIGIYF